MFPGRDQPLIRLGGGGGGGGGHALEHGERSICHCASQKRRRWRRERVGGHYEDARLKGAG